MAIILEEAALHLQRGQGYPNITVPAGYVFGMPVGMSMFSGPYKEPELIAMAYAFEQASKVRLAPTLPQSLVLK